jgi:hypothetical protein
LAQQIDGCRGLAAGTRLHSAFITGGVPEMPQERAIRGGADLVVATPGRLLAHLKGGRCALPALATLILDEADQLFDLGFFPDVKRIVSHLPARRQTLLFSATMPPEVAKVGRLILRDSLSVSIGAQGTPVSSVTQTVYPVPAHRKGPLLEHLLGRIKNPSVLVFTRTKHGAKRLARALNQAGHEAAELHSARTPAPRPRQRRLPAPGPQAVGAIRPKLRRVSDRSAQRYPSAERWPPSSLLNNSFRGDRTCEIPRKTAGVRRPDALFQQAARPSTISSRLPSPGLRHSSRFAPSFRTTYRPWLCLIVVPSVQLSPFRPLAA